MRVLAHRHQDPLALEPLRRQRRRREQVKVVALLDHARDEALEDAGARRRRRAVDVQAPRTADENVRLAAARALHHAADVALG
jgi:hypothetical protein